ncbi:Serum response factor-binding protein [Paramyrothecium foliicola]|nr:Serum response factor-binding protein [Paramyrothecium foliicola]
MGSLQTVTPLRVVGVIGQGLVNGKPRNTVESPLRPNKDSEIVQSHRPLRDYSLARLASSPIPLWSIRTYLNPGLPHGPFSFVSCASFSVLVYNDRAIPSSLFDYIRFIMLFKSMAAIVAATTLVQALPAPEERKADKPNQATTTMNGFEVVIVYATPEGGCKAPPTSCGALFPTSTSPADLPNHEKIEAEKKPSAYAEQPVVTPSTSPSATFIQEAPVATLKPNLHWDCDTKPAKNVIPVPPTEGSKFYYGVNDPSKAGEYAWLTYYFNQPSVNLDESDHITDVEYGPDGLAIHFASNEAWDYAVDTWLEKDELVLITYTEDCGAFEKQDRCFFQVKSITWKEGQHSIIAKGKPTHPEELVSRGESEWGYWVPRDDGPKKSPSSGRPSAAATVSTKGPKPTPISGSTGPGYGACTPPVDEKYGLPTACFGNFFDRDLDTSLGSEDLSDKYREFLESIILDDDTSGNSSALQRRSIDRRCGWFCDVINDVIVEPVKDVFDAVQDALTVSADIDEDFSFKVPDAGSPLLDLGLDFVTSPWGEAIQLFDAQLPSTNGLDGHVNIYCVGCGVSGTARLYGKATWVPFKGITEGFIEISNDLQFAVKIGIDAEVSFSHTLAYNLFSVGLPGLSFGVITIGPRIDVGANVGLEAAASGKLLAGAEMGLQNAVARLDFIDSSKTQATGWEPFFKPVFEAEGRIRASASLGLPVGIHCGIKIATFDLSAGIVDEPSIKGTAEVAAEFSLGEDGELDGGIVDVNGCKGISGQLSWRNKLYVKVTGFDNINLLDTNDRVLTEMCIPIGPQDDARQPSEQPSAVEPPVAEPPVAEPPAVEPPVAETPVAEPPVIETPIVEPPVQESPVVENPDVGTPVPESPGDEETPVAEVPVETPGVGSGGQILPTPSPQTTPSNSTIRAPLTISTTPVAVTSKTPLPSLTKSAKLSGTVSPTSSTPTSSIKIPTNSTRPSEPLPFKDEEGFEYAPLVGSSLSSKLASCSNGNMYVFAANGQSTPSCSDIWAFKDEALVADGTSRALHYYNNTMSLLGVSRLRIEDESSIPSGGVIVAWAPHGQDADDKMYLAIDPSNQVFYPLVCEYENGSGAKVFLAKSPTDGIEILKSKDVQHSITGGKVSECYPLRLVKGASLTYGTYGVSTA